MTDLLQTRAGSLGEEHPKAFPDPSQQRWNIIQQTVQNHAAKNTPGGPLLPLIFEIADSAIELAIGGGASGTASGMQDEFDKWMAVIHSLSELDFASKSCFLYLYDIYEDEILIGLDRQKQGKLLAYAGTSYRLQIASYCLPATSGSDDARDKISEFSLVLKTNAAVLAPIDESSRVSSRYDDHKLSFRTTGGFGSVGTAVAVHPQGSDLYVPVIELPVYIQIPGWQWGSLIVAVPLYLWSLFGIPRLVQKPSEGWAKVLQAVAVILVASFGKDSVGPILKALWKSRLLAKLRTSWATLKAKM